MHFLAVMITDTDMVMDKIREVKSKSTRKMVTDMAMGTNTNMDISMSMNMATVTVISLSGLLVTSTNMIIRNV
jgi:hypothetical protein